VETTQTRKNETPPDPEGPEAESLCSWWRRGRVGLPIPKLLTGHDRGEKRSVGRFGFDAHELFSVDGDAVEHLPNQFFPLLVGHPGVRPQDRQVSKKFGRPFQVRQFGRLGRYGHQPDFHPGVRKRAGQLQVWMGAFSQNRSCQRDTRWEEGVSEMSKPGYVTHLPL